MIHVACIGEAMVELSMAGDIPHLGVAGDTLNTAIYLKRCAPELEVDYITQVGDDPFSARIRAAIAAEDIGTDHVRTVPGGTPGLYAITTDDAGERTFTYWRSASAARRLFSDGDFSILSGYDVIYLSGISLAILPQAVRLALLDHITRSGARFAYDSNYRPRLWEDTETARAITAACWTKADIALPSIDDEMALFAETEAEATSRLCALPGTGALKRGAEGPLSIGGNVAQIYPSAPRVIDTTAAGDSFNGAYLAALLAGASPADALRAGHDMAAEVVQHRGAILPRP